MRHFAAAVNPSRCAPETYRRLTSVQQPGSSIAYAWDARGNLTHDGVFTYTYNAAGRMVRAESITATLRYTYTVDGLRVVQYYLPPLSSIHRSK